MESKYRTRTRLERFYDRYPDYPRKEEEYLGVGAMMTPIIIPYQVGLDIVRMKKE